MHRLFQSRRIVLGANIFGEAVVEKFQQRQVAHPSGSIALPPTLWQSRGVVRAHEPPRSRGALLRRTAMPVLQAPTTLHRVAMLGNHLPRQCGIATFTTDLSTAIRTAYPTLDCMILAMNDAVGRHAYPAEVRFEINAPEVAGYQKAAEFINHAGVDVLSVQHEYGIFGGAAGAYLLGLLRDIDLPVVTTLHTILAAPDDAQRAVMDELTQRSARLVVMSAAGAALLHQVHDVPLDKIDLIPHGIPTLPHAQRSKTQLGFDDKLLMLTFGLLSPDKGIEHVIDAMPAIVAQHPNAIYVILGATHPHVKAHAGEAYREMLQARARMLGVAANVVFANRFVSQHELNQYLAAADIYLTPYLKPEQSTSGTLAYAVGAGKAVVSTPYAYARELLANDRGVLVPWPADDPTAIAREVQSLLGDPERRQRMRARGTAFGRSMLWPAVATGYVQSFERARNTHAATTSVPTAVAAPLVSAAPAAVGTLATLPAIKLDHLRAMTDSCGMLQHA